MNTKLTVFLAAMSLVCVANAEPKFSFRCQFSEGASAHIDSGRIQQRRIVEDKLEIVFDQIDKNAGTARVIGNGGAFDLSAFYFANDSLHLVEVTGAGNMVITTVFDIKNALEGRRSFAVHSRHNNFSRAGQGAPMPSQYYGFCLSI